MEHLFKIDWQQMFVPSTSLIEIFVRGSLMYLLIFIIMRLVLNRQSGGMSITDLLVVVMLADAAQNGMSGDYKSITEGILLVSTIIFWSYALDWLGYHVPPLQRFLQPTELLLVKNGKMHRRNMQHELVTEGELLSQLRQQGVEDISEVKSAYMEGDGRISVISKDGKTQGTPEQQIN